MKAKLPQMDFGRKLVQTSIPAAQGKSKETSIESPQSVPLSRESSDVKVTCSHFPQSKGMENSVPVDTLAPSDSHQETGLALEDIVAGSKMPIVRGFIFLTEFDMLMKCRTIPQRHPRLQMHKTLSNHLPDHWKFLKKGQKVDNGDKFASRKRDCPILEGLRTKCLNQLSHPSPNLDVL